jgi:hypothetical protein
MICEEIVMKYLVLIMLLFISSFGKSDEYQVCQMALEVTKEHYKSSVEELLKKKSEIASADSVESLSEATGRDYEEMISGLLKDNFTKEKANEFVTDIMKPFEMASISTSIKIKELHNNFDKEPDEFFWNSVFDTCVKKASEKL